MASTPDSEHTAVLVERRGPVTVVTLNRPDRANAFDSTMLHELNAAIARIAEDTRTKAVIITGAGRHFSSGADLRESSAKRRAARLRYPHGVDLGRLCQPVIAAINGPALGGGCEIALSCDFRFIAADAVIGLTEILFGALPTGGGTARLPGVVGLSWARKLIMTGEPVDAALAARIGLVDQVAPPRAVLASAERFARRLARHPRWALRLAKSMLDGLSEPDLADALAIEREKVRTMATWEQWVAARAAASETMPAYARIFGGNPPSSLP